MGTALRRSNSLCVVFFFFFPPSRGPRLISPWGQDGIADNDSSSWRMDLGWLCTSYSNCLLKYVNLNKREGKSNSLLFDSSIKNGPTCPEITGLMDVLGFLGIGPLGSQGPWQDMLRIHSLTPKMVLLFGTCSTKGLAELGLPLPPTPMFLNQVYLRPQAQLELVFAATENYFVEFDFLKFALWNQQAFWMCFFRCLPRPPSPTHPTPFCFESHCCEPLPWTLTTHRSHRKCSTVLSVLSLNPRETTWKVKHGWSSLGAPGIRGLTVGVVIIRQHCCPGNPEQAYIV